VKEPSQKPKQKQLKQKVETFVLLAQKYPGPLALDAVMSRDGEEFLKRSCVQINISPELAKKLFKGNLSC
jgi:uncharacterized C2H2 Zn-finger protein